MIAFDLIKFISTTGDVDAAEITARDKAVRVLACGLGEDLYAEAYIFEDNSCLAVRFINELKFSAGETLENTAWNDWFLESMSLSVL